MSLEHRYLDIISGQSRSPLASLTRAVLAVAEIPYRTAITVRNRRYDRHPPVPAGLPTISVGNITAGGTGKTPVVQWIATHLVQLGHHPTILTRGYTKPGSDFSDEAAVLQAALPGVPVVAHPDRIEGANTAVDQNPETTCFILDDGFQHRRFPRELDLVLINATQPFGFGHVHPRGLLREPMSGLRRASAIVVTHASEVPPEGLRATQDQIRRYTQAPIFHCDHINETMVSADSASRHGLSHLVNTPFFLFTGIGQPLSLIGSLKQFAGYRGCHSFGDHHPYTASDVERLRQLASRVQAVALVTTEKDWVKVAPLWAPDPSSALSMQLYRLQLEVRFWDNEQATLLKMITDKLFRA